MLKIRDIMTTEVAVATPDMSLREAMALLADRHISGAPVVSGGRLVGIFSATDLLVYVAELDGALPSVSFRRRQTPLEEVTVSEIMTRGVKTLSPDCTVELAARFMHHAQIHRVPVVDGQKIVGIVTTTDIALAVAEEKLSHSPAAA